MKATILFPIFQKRDYVERSLRSCLEQTAPCEIIIFGPPSTDGTDDIIGSVVAIDHVLLIPQINTVPFTKEINGHAVRWYRTPDNGYAGMNAGMNADFNWVQQHVTGDVCLFTSGDDVMEPNRVERVLWAFERFNPSWVINKQILKREPDKIVGTCPYFPHQHSRFVEPAEAITHQIGSSGGFAWATDLYKKYGPINGIVGNDVVLPVMALFERGIYYLDEALHTMYLHDDIDNLGTEGQVRGARTEQERMQLEEVKNYQLACNWITIRDMLIQHGHHQKMDQATIDALYAHILGSTHSWMDARNALTMAKVKPMAFGAKALGMIE